MSHSPAERFRWFRDQLELSRDEMAVLLNCDREWIDDAESGRLQFTEISREFWFRLSVNFGDKTAETLKRLDRIKSRMPDILAAGPNDVGRFGI